MKKPISVRLDPEIIDMLKAISKMTTGKENTTLGIEIAVYTFLKSMKVDLDKNRKLH